MSPVGAKTDLAVVAKHAAANHQILSREGGSADIHQYGDAILHFVMGAAQHHRAVLRGVGREPKMQAAQLYVSAFDFENLRTNGAFHQDFVQVAPGDVPYQKLLVGGIREETTR